MFGFFKKSGKTDTPAATPPVADPAATPESVSAPVVSAPVPESKPPASVLVPASEAQPAVSAQKRSWTDRLKAGLARTRQQFGGGLASLFGRRKIDEDLLEELESTLLMADCGVDATQYLIDDLRLRWKRDRLE
ncbi:MAG: signal recognition particle-docking protein FtsY, partial [Betaproteobacteria bacterium HGW-Betaproteobacteria-21]